MDDDLLRPFTTFLTVGICKVGARSIGTEATGAVAIGAAATGTEAIGAEAHGTEVNGTEPRRNHENARDSTTEEPQMSGGPRSKVIDRPGGQTHGKAVWQGLVRVLAMAGYIGNLVVVGKGAIACCV